MWPSFAQHISQVLAFGYAMLNFIIHKDYNAIPITVFTFSKMKADLYKNQLTVMKNFSLLIKLLNVSPQLFIVGLV